MVTMKYESILRRFREDERPAYRLVGTLMTDEVRNWTYLIPSDVERPPYMHLNDDEFAALLRFMVEHIPFNEGRIS
jgi:hypothetical protein